MTKVSNAAGPRFFISLVAALVLLDASVTFRNVWPTPYVRWAGELSPELAIVIVILALLAIWLGRVPHRLIAAVAAIWTTLVIGHYVDVTAAAVYGRNINLYWDVRHISSVAGLLFGAAHIWLTIAVVLAIIAIPVVVFWPVRWAVRTLAAALDIPRLRLVLAAASGIAIACFALGLGTLHDVNDYDASPVFTTPVTQAWGRQISLLATEMSSRGRAALPPSPPLAASFSRINGADVILVFVESYGAVSWDRPQFVTDLAASRARFERDIHDTGRDVVSAFVQSPTFGGSSWLAHMSLLSGIDVRDEDTYTVLMTQSRDTLAKEFARHGYRSVAVMPGLQSAWPEGAFYGFNDIYAGADIDYRGPDFGWWSVPDQYTFAWLDRHELAPQPRPPVFLVFPTITTHTPFSPIAPYQPDWSRLLTDRPYDQKAEELAADESPDWMNLGPSYARALEYDFESIGGLLRQRRDRDLVMILIGDHQPPAAVSGEHASWDVPVHVIASRPGLLDGLVARGFRRGLAPAHPALGHMNALTRVLVEVF